MVLTDAKILITGPAGQIAFPLARYLAADNDVWGIARFHRAEARERVEALGVTTRQVDIATGEFGDLPSDFTHLLHLAVHQGPGDDTEPGLRVNAEGTGQVMQHCRNARACLVMSTFSVYAPNPDRWHEYVETNPQGDTRQPHSPTYALTKIAQEATARSYARTLGLATTIARMNVSYGAEGGLPAYHLDWLMAGTPIVLRDPGPTPYSPIHQDDINRQAGLLLDVASVPATIVNWAGDEVVTAEEWLAEIEKLTGRRADVQRQDFPAASIGSVSGNRLRRELIGDCAVGWRQGITRMVSERAGG